MLGVALSGQGRHKEAEAAYREAIRLRPDDPKAHNNLGNALYYQGRHKEAEAAYREAIRVQHDYPDAHSNLGDALSDQGRYPEAEAACREAIRLRHDYPEAHSNLGKALSGQGRYKEAEAACREAIRLRHDYPEAHNNLGVALSGQGRHKEAEAAYREAIRLRHDNPEAHCNLGDALINQGRFAEALEPLRRGHALGSKLPGWPHPSGEWVRRCERLVELDRNLPVVMRGDSEPASAVERLELAALCRHPAKRLYAAAARLAAAAFAADPKLAADLRQQHRYNAACAAVLAAAGQGEAAQHLPDRVQPMLRGQALRWLRDDLALYAKFAERDDPRAKEAVRQRLTRWQQDADLAGVRDHAELAKLPDTEREAWEKLWAEVEALQERARESK
jgi:Flp pilus assembly protein TadD